MRALPSTPERDFLRELAAERLTAEVKAEQASLPCAMCEATGKEPFIIPKPSLHHCAACRQVQIEYSKAIWKAKTSEALDRAREIVIQGGGLTARERG